MAVTSSNPNAGCTWTRYVDSGQGLRRASREAGEAPERRSDGPVPESSVDTAQHHQRAGADVDLLALLHRFALAHPWFPGHGRRSIAGQQRQIVSVEDDDPMVAPVLLGDGER